MTMLTWNPQPHAAAKSRGKRELSYPSGRAKPTPRDLKVDTGAQQVGLALLFVEDVESLLLGRGTLQDLSEASGPGSSIIIEDALPNKQADNTVMPLSSLKHHFVAHGPQLPHGGLSDEEPESLRVRDKLKK